MPRTTLAPKEITFNLRLDQALKTEFVAATGAEDKPAAEVLRSLMREYVRQAQQRAFLAEAERQAKLISNSASGQGDDAEALLWVENVSAPLPPETEGDWFRLPGQQ
jgi:hypothetical protein